MDTIYMNTQFNNGNGYDNLYNKFKSYISIIQVIMMDHF